MGGKYEFKFKLLSSCSHMILAKNSNYSQLTYDTQPARMHQPKKLLEGTTDGHIAVSGSASTVVSGHKIIDIQQSYTVQ